MKTAALAWRAADEARVSLHGRLWARRGEIERAVRTRIDALADPDEESRPEYAEGRRTAIAAAVDYGIAAIERGEERLQPVPTAILAQARLAARSGISLDSVLRRYFAGYTLLGDFLVEEAEEGGLCPGATLQRLLRTQAVLFDRVVAAVSEEYRREARGRVESVEQRRAERVGRLLDGELIEASDLAYELEGWHLGLVARGQRPQTAIRELAAALDRQPLVVPHEEGIVWGWLGGRRRIDPVQLLAVVSKSWPEQLPLAIGEPGQGVAGWRLTHQQARAALPIAVRSSQGHVRYADVALLASLLRDDLLATSLRDLYLAPLAEERDGGKAMRETLRAYFAAGRNVSSAAAALGVNRHTVANRLRTIESRLARPLSACIAEIEAVLRLEELNGPASSGARPSGAVAFVEH